MKLKINRKSGVSLIALVITVIVMAILSSAIVFQLDDTNVVPTINKVGEKEEFNAQKEIFETIRDELALESFGQVTIDEYIDELLERDLIATDILEESEYNKIVTTKDGYVLAVEKDEDFGLNLFMGQKDVMVRISPNSINETIGENETKKKTLKVNSDDIIGDLTWETTDESVAKVIGDNKRATVTLVGAGEAQIIARYGSIKATCTIKVNE